MGEVYRGSKDGTTIAYERFGNGPALIMNGSRTDPRLKDAARAIAEAIPGAQHRELTGQTHNVKPGVLAPAVVEFFTAPMATTSSRT